MTDHDPTTCRNGDHYGQCSGATPLAATHYAAQGSHAQCGQDGWTVQVSQDPKVVTCRKCLKIMRNLRGVQS